MTAQELKNSILQLAVQGKLVEQRLEEGTAKELLAQIKAEKEQLIKDKKIKKEKPLPEITDEEKSFDIPDSWEWVRLGDVCTKLVDGDHNPPKGVDIITPYIMASSTNINKNTVVELEKVRYLTKEVFDKENERTNAQAGDIFFTSVGTLGRSCVYKGGYNICFQRSVSVIRTLIFNYYLKYLFDSAYFQYKVTREATGTAQKGFYLKQLALSLIPIPPLEEQKRIVSKIEEILPYIEQYDKAYTKLEVFNKKFPEEMKKSVLQLAMQGKLVEQRPEEGTAEELYQQIVEEKAKLIKEGRIKKEKPLAEITDDEIPFEIPDSWKWVRVGNIFNVGTGMTPLKAETKFYKNGSIPWVTSALTSERFIEKVDIKITEYALKNTSLTLYPAHTLIVAMYGQGKTRGQVSELLIDATVNQACAVLGNIIFESSFINFVYFWFLFNYEKIRKKADGTSQPNLNLNKIRENIIPLPPLAEQKRIVAKIEEILPYCEQLIK